MALAADEERALARIEEELCRSDPRLAAKLSMFNRLTRTEAMPERELLTPPRRLRRFSRRAGLWTAHWRLYRPVPSRGLPTAPPGPATPSRPNHPGRADRPGGRNRPGGHGHPGRPANLGLGPSPFPSPGPGPRSSLSYHPAAGRYRWPSRLAAILPVIAVMCALGVAVAIFSALSHFDTGAARGPASSCQTVTLTGCQSAAHARPKH